MSINSDGRLVLSETPDFFDPVLKSGSARYTPPLRRQETPWQGAATIVAPYLPAQSGVKLPLASQPDRSELGQDAVTLSQHTQRGSQVPDDRGNYRRFARLLSAMPGVQLMRSVQQFKVPHYFYITPKKNVNVKMGKT